MSGPTLVSSVCLRLRLQEFYLLRSIFPDLFGLHNLNHIMMIRNPGSKLPVWPVSLSLAATQEIDVSFFSYGYLDVSVPRVPLITLWIHVMIHTHCRMWVPPFGHLRVDGYVLLTAAYRSLSRPSSAPSAKASTWCSCYLTKMLGLLFVFFVTLASAPRSLT